jgi:hypothetical protein
MKAAKRYEGDKRFQVHRRISSIKMELLFETDNDLELRAFLQLRADLAGCIFRQRNEAGEWKLSRMRKQGEKSAKIAPPRPRMAFRKRRHK